MRKFQLFIKRAFDLVAGCIALLCMIVVPVLIVIPVLIRLTSKGPAVFTQERIGKDGKPFEIYKFRTMLIPEESYDAEGNLMTPKQRITKLGRVLRKTSLDELMQIFNIINGTMSFVGPRPTIPEQVANYTDYHRRRLEMRPGVTGWAQVNGRNDLNWDQKIAYDIEYIDNFSLWFDIKTLFKTVAVVFKSEGIAFQDGSATLSSGKEQEQETAAK